MTPSALLSLSVMVAGSAVFASHGVASHATKAAPPKPSVGSTRPWNAALERSNPDSLLGVFEGRTPCGTIATEFTGFPAQNCEKIKWRLALYRDPATGNPTTWFYNGTRATRQGRWRIERNAGPDRTWTVYHLERGSNRTLRLLDVDNKVLLLLDQDGGILVGDASWSYALNRTARTTP